MKRVRCRSWRVRRRVRQHAGVHANTPIRSTSLKASSIPNPPKCRSMSASAFILMIIVCGGTGKRAHAAAASVFHQPWWAWSPAPAVRPRAPNWDELQLYVRSDEGDEVWRLRMAGGSTSGRQRSPAGECRRLSNPPALLIRDVPNDPILDPEAVSFG